MKLLIGTYTKKVSQGIYEMTLENDKLSDLRLVAKTDNPTYLDYDKATHTLYSVISIDGQGGIGVWKEKDNEFVLVTKIVEAGSPPCYVKYDPNEKLIYDANYHKGQVNIYKTGDVEKVIQYGDGSHAHYMDIDPKTQDVFTCDLGKDTIHKYRLLNEIATYKTETGMGPRHIAFHPNLPILYVFGELNNTIEVLEDQEFDLVSKQIISTINSTTQKSSGAAIRISADGHYLYVSNRGEDTIVVFQILESGLLQEIQRISTQGKHPRDFNISPDGEYVVAANLDTNNLTLYKRDQNKGLLSIIEDDVYAPEPVCIKFI